MSRKSTKHKYVAIVVIETDQKALKRELAAMVRDNLFAARIRPNCRVEAVRVRSVDFD